MITKMAKISTPSMTYTLWGRTYKGVHPGHDKILTNQNVRIYLIQDYWDYKRLYIINLGTGLQKLPFILRKPAAEAFQPKALQPAAESRL